VDTIFGLPLSQQIDSNGRPLDGARLFIFDANTSDPATAYEDFGLEVELPHPIEADADGRIPEFWLPDGDYRVRLTDKNGIQKFDLQSVTALGPSSGEGGGGEGVTDSQIATTGDLKWRLAAGTLSGWVRLNGRTIGSATSGGTERANADTQTLYEYLWANCSNSICPVSSGRGASAADDFAANKTIGLPDMRGRTLVALDNMGNSAAGVLSGATTALASGGSETKSILQVNLPDYTLPDTLDVSMSGVTNMVRNLSETVGNRTTSNPNASTVISVNWTSIDIDESRYNVSGSVSSGGSGTAMSTMDPYRLGTIYIKL
jgi:hypothetical protein